MEKGRNLGRQDERIPRVVAWSLKRAKTAKKEWEATLRTLPNIVKVQLRIKPVEGKRGQYFIHDTSVYDKDYHW